MFVIGRSKNASFIILSLFVSKSQCVFQKKNEDWTVCDKSTNGTFLNGVKLEKDVPVVISDGDSIEFGPPGKFKYTFHRKGTCSSPPTKRTKLSENDGNSQKTQEEEKLEIEMKLKNLREELEGEHSEEKRIAEEKLLQEKRLLEDKVKEMQRLLEEKEKSQELLNKKLKEKEEERIRDLELLQESKDAMMEKLKTEVAEREELVRIQLMKEIQNLQDEKTKLEDNIKGELSKKEGESAENLKRLQDELEKIKKDLMNVEGKKQYLEKELEETTKAKEDASESRLKAKQEVLENFGELMETELQCSICNELFVTAITLNCTHTFCKCCIAEWKKKKKECPVCRTKITSENRSIALDNFIDRMISSLSDEMKLRRQEIVEERQVRELLSDNQNAGSTATKSRRERRGRRQNEIPSSSSENTSQNNDVIVISSETSDSESEQRTQNSSDLSDYEELDEENEDYMDGLPGAYYGGYGYCYRCGRRGHWARGCPD